MWARSHFKPLALSLLFNSPIMTLGFIMEQTIFIWLAHKKWEQAISINISYHKIKMSGKFYIKIWALFPYCIWPLELIDFKLNLINSKFNFKLLPMLATALYFFINRCTRTLHYFHRNIEIKKNSNTWHEGTVSWAWNKEDNMERTWIQTVTLS